jgi:hypothetical protein
MTNSTGSFTKRGPLARASFERIGLIDGNAVMVPVLPLRAKTLLSQIAAKSLDALAGVFEIGGLGGV